MSADEEHDITVCLLQFAKEPLLDHLSMVYKADELPLSQMNDTLRHIERHVHNRDLLVHGSCCFVSQQRIVNHPRLGHRLLRVVKLVVSADL